MRQRPTPRVHRLRMWQHLHQLSKPGLPSTAAAKNPLDTYALHANLSSFARRCGHLPSCAGLLEEEVTWGRVPRYSTHSCVKGRFGRNWRQ